MLRRDGTAGCLCMEQTDEGLEELSRACSIKKSGPGDQVLGLSRRRDLDKEPEQKKKKSQKTHQTLKVGRNLYTGYSNTLLKAGSLEQTLRTVSSWILNVSQDSPPSLDNLFQCLATIRTKKIILSFLYLFVPIASSPFTGHHHPLCTVPSGVHTH